MYDNIGQKIKGLAKAIFIILSIVSVCAGIALMGVDEDLMWSGIVALLFGPILAWIASWTLYGFGEIIDKVSDIERNTRGKNSEPSSMVKGENETEKEPAFEKTLDVKELVIKKCEFCGKENVPVAHCKIVDELGIRFRDLCCDCIEKNKANISIK